MYTTIHIYIYIYIHTHYISLSIYIYIYTILSQTSPGRGGVMLMLIQQTKCSGVEYISVGYL